MAKKKTLNNGYIVWDGLKEEEKVNKGDHGKKVWVAGEYKTKFRIIRSVHEVGEKSWPKGGVQVEELETGRIRSYYLNKVRLHPDNFKKKA